MIRFTLEVCDRLKLPPFPEHPMNWTPLQRQLYIEYGWKKFEEKNGVIPQELLDEFE